MLEVFKSSAGRSALMSVERAVRSLTNATLASGSLGGTQIWIDITLLGPSGTGFMLHGFGLGSDVWDADELPRDYRALATQKRNRSVRTGMSGSDANELGDKPLGDETPDEGNIVFDLTPDGTYELIVSGAGLSDTHNERLCEFVGSAIMLQLPGLLRSDMAEIRAAETAAV